MKTSSKEREDVLDANTNTLAFLFAYVNRETTKERRQTRLRRAVQGSVREMAWKYMKINNVLCSLGSKTERTGWLTVKAYNRE